MPTMPTDNELIHLGQLCLIRETCQSDLAEASKRPRLRTGTEHTLENYRKLGHAALQHERAHRQLNTADEAVEDEIARLLAAPAAPAAEGQTRRLNFGRDGQPYTQASLSHPHP